MNGNLNFLNAAQQILNNNEGVTLIAITKSNNTFISLNMGDNSSIVHYEALESALKVFSVNTEGKAQETISSVDMSQPKYKIADVAKLLEVTKQTLNNWSKGKGGHLRTFKEEGTAMFVLEEDFANKYKELKGIDLNINEEFRSRYCYR